MYTYAYCILYMSLEHGVKDNEISNRRIQVLHSLFSSSANK